MKIMTMIRVATEKNEDEQMMGETKEEGKYFRSIIIYIYTLCTFSFDFTI